MSQQGTNKGCEMFGTFGIFVQVGLGLGSFGILIIKRYFEKPKRQWKIWALDASKQAISQLFAHSLNVYFSVLLSQNKDDDPCNWYFITIFLDTTLGVFICYMILTALERFLENLKSGNYIRVISPENQILDDNYRNSQNQDQLGQRSLLRPIISVDKAMWSAQLLIWLTVVLFAKLILYGIQLLSAPILEGFANFLFSNMDNMDLKLFLVMVVIPLFLNGFQVKQILQKTIFQFWIQDNFLKKKEFTSIEKQFAMSEMYEMECELQQMNAPTHESNQSPYRDSDHNQRDEL